MQKHRENRRTLGLTPVGIRRVENDALRRQPCMENRGTPRSFASVGLRQAIQLVQGFREDIVTEPFEHRVDRFARRLVVNDGQLTPTSGTLK